MNEIYPSFFNTFTKISKKIHSGQAVSDILTCIVKDISKILKAKGCIYWLLNHEKKKIDSKIFHGFDYRSLSGVNYGRLMKIFNPGSGPIFINDARNDPRLPDYEKLGKKLVGSVTGMHFNIAPPYSGILAVYFFTQNKALTPTEQALVSALGEQGALALQKTIGYDEKIVKMAGQIIESFALAIEAKDPATHGHSQRVARLARLTAREMNMADDEVETVYQAGILHDIGKIGMGDAVIEKLGKLSSRELSAVRQHPVLGVKILSPLTFFRRIEPLIENHHELFNGSGYPRGLKEKQIPLGARILTVCDAFETMISGRPNMPEHSVSYAVEILKQDAGIRFDPDVVGALIRGLRNHPDLFCIEEPACPSLAHLKKELSEIAARNKIKEKLTNRFPVSF